MISTYIKSFFSDPKQSEKKKKGEQSQPADTRSSEMQQEGDDELLLSTGSSVERVGSVTHRPHRPHPPEHVRKPDQASTRHTRDHIDTRLGTEEAGRLRNLQDELDTMKKKNRKLEKALLVEQNQNKGLSQQLDVLKTRNGTLETELLTNRKQYEDFYNQDYARLVDDYHHLREHSQALLAEKEQVLEVVRVQLQSKTAELQSAQVFINQADSLSAADIIAIANAVNAEILQLTALLSDSLNFVVAQSEAKLTPVVQELIGKDLVQALLDPGTQDDGMFDPTMVQLGLQACLVHCCYEILTTWSFQNDNGVLNSTYMSIIQKEKQSVAGRWRSMTRCHTGTPRDLHDCLKMVIHRIVYVLMFAGYMPDDMNTFKDDLREKLVTVVTQTFRLRTAVGEQITSMDVYPIAFMSGASFDPQIMEDTYADERRAGKKLDRTGQLVAGSTELGLRSCIKTAEGIEEGIMLKSKVVLCSALEGE